MKTCGFNGCDSPVKCGGLCSGHFEQRRVGSELRPLGPRSQTARMTFHERFWHYVTKGDGCWNWTGAKNDRGYGQISLKDKALYAHRLSYEMAHGEIPSGMVIDHICHNPSCVNPRHLQAVTVKENGENVRSAPVTSTTGVRGVSYAKRERRYHAYATHNGTRYTAGYFTTLEEASKAVVSLRNELHTNNLADRQAEREEGLRGDSND